MCLSLNESISEYITGFIFVGLLVAEWEGMDGLGADNARLQHAVFNKYFTVTIGGPFHSCDFLGDGDGGPPVIRDTMA
jgi:hypothetical protein